ncbi:Sir2 family NAD-dependent protein deacetylase [Luteibacter sp.]|uniref:SIR2 family NAD-dependent protein deacylase n=1 Tax=Luteibacter sp. TaxID=1886636 RepID=UPI0025BDCAAD|nr:Sir2 family NAD-dependent protein deacetylase [Luteibacter sp.]
MEKIVIFTGAGVSAESGLKTFRAMDGLWNDHAIEDVATPEGWARNPALVLDFYNQRRQEVLAAHPNAAHEAIARLESMFDVTVITQNIDDLHERAGSSKVLHVHGEILKARSSIDPELIHTLDTPTIAPGDRCAKGSQLRPDVVWFGEAVRFMDESETLFANASRVLTIGTSLTVYPAAGLVKHAPYLAEKYLVSPDVQKVPYGFHFMRGLATTVVPHIVTCWMEGRSPVR